MPNDEGSLFHRYLGSKYSVVVIFVIGGALVVQSSFPRPPRHTITPCSTLFRGVAHVLRLRRPTTGPRRGRARRGGRSPDQSPPRDAGVRLALLRPTPEE